jgi:hypothetical protein
MLFSEDCKSAWGFHFDGDWARELDWKRWDSRVTSLAISFRDKQVEGSRNEGGWDTVQRHRHGTRLCYLFSDTRTVLD